MFYRVAAIGQGQKLVLIDGNTYHTQHNLPKCGVTQDRLKIIADTPFRGHLKLTKDGDVQLTAEGPPIHNDEELQLASETYPLVVLSRPSEQIDDSITVAPQPQLQPQPPTVHTVKSNCSRYSQELPTMVIQRAHGVPSLQRKSTSTPTTQEQESARYCLLFKPDQEQFLCERFLATLSAIHM